MRTATSHQVDKLSGGRFEAPYLHHTRFRPPARSGERTPIPADTESRRKSESVDTGTRPAGRRVCGHNQAPLGNMPRLLSPPPHQTSQGLTNWEVSARKGSLQKPAAKRRSDRHHSRSRAKSSAHTLLTSEPCAQAAIYPKPRYRVNVLKLRKHDEHEPTVTKLGSPSMEPGFSASSARAENCSLDRK